MRQIPYGSILVRFLELLKINFRLAVQNNLLAAALYLLLVPILRGIENLDEVRAAECLEQSVILIGIPLIVPLHAPEQTAAVWEAVFTRKTAQRLILLLRVLMAALALALLTGIFAGIMIMKNCTFPYVSYVLGTAASGATLGSIGFFTAVFRNSVTAGYLASIGYFLFNYLGYMPDTSVFYLFSMGTGNFVTKIWLAGISMALTAVTVILSVSRWRR